MRLRFAFSSSAFAFLPKAAMKPPELAVGAEKVGIPAGGAAGADAVKPDEVDEGALNPPEDAAFDDAKSTELDEGGLNPLAASEPFWFCFEVSVGLSNAAWNSFAVSLALSGNFGYEIGSLTLARFSVAGALSASSSSSSTKGLGRFLLTGAVAGGCERLFWKAGCFGVWVC